MDLLTRLISTLFSAAFVLALSVVSVSAQEEPAEYFLYGYEFKAEEGERFTRTETVRTGDHHCDDKLFESCKGEPTRTGYRIEDRIDSAAERIVDASLSCDSGLCAFSQVVRVGYNNSSSWAAFDVWSRPMNWTLTTSFVPLEWIRGEQKQVDNDRVEAGSIFLVEHNRRTFISMDMDVDIPGLGRVRMSPGNPIEPYFSLVHKDSVGFTDIFNIRYNGDSE